MLGLFAVLSSVRRVIAKDNRPDGHHKGEGEQDERQGDNSRVRREGLKVCVARRPLHGKGNLHSRQDHGGADNGHSNLRP